MTSRINADAAQTRCQLWEPWNEAEKLRQKVVNKESMKGRYMRAFVRGRIKTNESELITDEYRGYMGMEKVLPYRVIKHDEWCVDGDVHTNTIEGFWALLKCGMFGSFHSVSRKHL